MLVTVDSSLPFIFILQCLSICPSVCKYVFAFHSCFSLLLSFLWQEPNSDLHEESRDVKLQMDVCEPPPVTVEGTRRRRRERIVIGRNVATRESKREKEVTKCWWRETVVWKEMQKCSISVMRVKSKDFMSRSTHSIMNGMRVDTISNTSSWIPWSLSVSLDFFFFFFFHFPSLQSFFSFLAKKELHCHDFFVTALFLMMLSLSLVNLDC